MNVLANLGNPHIFYKDQADGHFVRNWTRFFSRQSQISELLMTLTWFYIFPTNCLKLMCTNSLSVFIVKWLAETWEELSF